MIAQAWTKITLADGTTAKIDACDEGFVSRFKWFSDGDKGICVKMDIPGNSIRKRTTRRIYLHRLLTMATDLHVVHFRNGNMFDCRTCNLIKITWSTHQRLLCKHHGKIGACKIKSVWEKGRVFPRRVKNKDGTIYHSYHVRMSLPNGKTLSSCAATKKKGEEILQRWRFKYDDKALCALPEEMYDGNADYAGKWGSDFDSLSMMSHVYQRQYIS
ncbi:hypothetical protein OpiT1DRAFT_03876 [Opitutaceae bacterium TAV1]|nr:hypothetical protein OpiT1DRAFT_03876 [Opitutaceae bacterium TAV1]